VDKPDATELAVERTNMAVERTVMAADRTLMAWIRTSLSLIGFGFTFFKLLQFLQEQGATPLMRLQGPRNFGIALVCLGIFPLAISAYQYWKYLEGIRATGRAVSRSPTLIVAGLVALTGLFALTNIIFAIGPFQ